MDVQTRSTTSISPFNHQMNVTPQDCLEIVWRRKWWVILPLIVGACIAYGVSLLIPSLYRSTTLILVEPPRVSTAYVSPTITSSVDDRLRTISQQILSRTNLTRIIKDLGLYKESTATPAPVSADQQGWLRRAQTKVKNGLIRLGLYTPPASVPVGQEEIPDSVIMRMRQDINVKVSGRDFFSVTYSGTEPATVMRVANTLALLFIEENLKVRERLIEGTSEFIESQLQEAGRDLERREQMLREFKTRHRGALPSELENHFRSLERLQQELQTIHESLPKHEALLTEERNIALKIVEDERQAIQGLLTASQPVPDAPAETRATPAGVNPRVAALQQELTRLRAVFNDTYPDVVLIKQQLAELNQGTEAPANGAESPREQGTASAATETTGRSFLGGLSAQLPPEVASLAEGGSPAPATPSPFVFSPARSKRVVALENDLAALKGRREKVLSQIQWLEKKIEEIPANAERLTDITRDYGASEKSYQTLLDKKLNAKISENLEKKQKSEQFRILDPANLPTTPYKPQRPFIVTVGGVLGAGAGLGCIFLLHFLSPRFRKPEDFYSLFNLPVLATIPRYSTGQDKDHKLVVVEDHESYAAEQYRILYTKINDISKASGDKVFCISSAVQGEGKTVTALNLAVVMARDFGRRTLVIEGDFRRSSIPRYLNVELESGLVDILSGNGSAPTTMVPFADTLVPFIDDNLAILPAVRRPENFSHVLSSHKMQHLFEMLREFYDFILIDSPPILPLSDMNLFKEVVDSIVMVVRAESTSQATLLKALNILGSNKVSGIVLNDVRQPFSTYYQGSYYYTYQPDGAKNAAR